MTMPTCPVGSITARVLNRVDDIPTAISGELSTLVQEKIQFIQQYCGVSIDEDHIPAQFQGPLTRLVMSDVMQQLNVQGIDASSFSIGDLSVGKSSSNVLESSNALRDQAMDELRALGRAVTFSRIIGV